MCRYVSPATFWICTYCAYYSFLSIVCFTFPPVLKIQRVIFSVYSCLWGENCGSDSSLPWSHISFSVHMQVATDLQDASLLLISGHSNKLLSFLTVS